MARRVLCFLTSVVCWLDCASCTTLDAQYEKEQTELTAEISVLEKAVKSYEKHEKDADRFIALIDKYENFGGKLGLFLFVLSVQPADHRGQETADTPCHSKAESFRAGSPALQNL